MILTPSEIEDARRFVAPHDRLVADLIETITAAEAEVRARLAAKVEGLRLSRGGYVTDYRAGHGDALAAVLALIQPEGAKA